MAQIRRDICVSRARKIGVGGRNASRGCVRRYTGHAGLWALPLSNQPSSAMSAARHAGEFCHSRPGHNVTRDRGSDERKIPCPLALLMRNPSSAAWLCAQKEIRVRQSATGGRQPLDDTAFWWLAPRLLVGLRNRRQIGNFVRYETFRWAGSLHFFGAKKQRRAENFRFFNGNSILYP